MSKMIGKISGVDWAKAPKGTTHILLSDNTWYDASDLENVVFWAGGASKWLCSSCWYDGGYRFITKDEDLEMNTKEVSKQVSCIEDLEVGMFLRTPYVRDPYLICNIHGDQVDTVLIDHNRFTYRNSPVTAFESWSYTYSGEYTPIVKKTEAEIKIKELEATIALAQKQLQEYKGMK